MQTFYTENPDYIPPYSSSYTSTLTILKNIVFYYSSISDTSFDYTALILNASKH